MRRAPCALPMKLRQIAGAPSPSSDTQPNRHGQPQKRKREAIGLPLLD